MADAHTTPSSGEAPRPDASRRRVAVVTGGASGIGYVCAEALIADGVEVIISSRKADDVSESAERLGPCATAVVADLASPEGPEILARSIGSLTDRVDILVNNAGITWGAPLGQYPADAFAKVLQVDLAAPFLLIQALLPHLQRAAASRPPARIVNLGSIDGHAVGGFDNYAYSAAKSGVHHLTRVLAYRLGPRGITVNCIAPGPIRTRMTSALLDEHEEQLLARNPLGRLCEPADIAGALIYLIGPTASYVTGAVIPVDGGLSIGPWWPADAPGKETHE